MTPCAAHEDRLIDYDDFDTELRAEVDRHVELCPGCREYLTTLREIDAALTATTAHVRLRDATIHRVRECGHAGGVVQLSAAPEWLDLIAAIAIGACVGGIVWSTASSALAVGF
jgi:anti-sigma factor RsiW